MSDRRPPIRFSALLLWLLLTGCVTGPTVRSIPPHATPGHSAWEEQQQVLQTLDAMIAAYQEKNSIRFSGYISERYAGDDMLLESRVRQNLSRAHDIGLRYTVDNITSDGRGKLFVALTYTREHTDIATTQRIVHTGQAALTFVREDQNYRLLSQPKPLF